MVGVIRPFHQHKSVDWLEVVRLGRTDWRVSDSRVAADDSRRLLGFVERVGRSRYEIMKLTDPIGWAYVPSFDIALASFGDAAEADPVMESERDRALRMIEGPLLRGRRKRMSSSAARD